jgi:hypothetical protein
MFGTNANQLKERLLLQKCAEADPIALEQFRTLSYQSCVARTIAHVNFTHNNVLTPKECEALRVLWTIQIFKAYRVLPHRRQTLYQRIHVYVFKAAKKYLKGKNG